MFFVYIIRSLLTGQIYVGLTGNLDRRLMEHNAGKCRTTRDRIPWQIISQEEHPSRIDARNREIFFKSGIGRERIRRLLEKQKGYSVAQ